jgi:cytochrome c553
MGNIMRRLQRVRLQQAARVTVQGTPEYNGIVARIKRLRYETSWMVRAAVFSGLMLLTAHRAAAAPPAPDFDRDVAPILVRRCLSCHDNSAKKGDLDLSRKTAAFTGGDSGPVIRPPKPEESLLWQRVSKEEMPPKKPLPAAERDVLRDWIASGAKWGSDPIDIFRYTTENRAGYDWWSLQGVVRPEPPPVKNAAWPRNAVDHFVLAKLEAAGLSPSPEADRRTLIRRLSLDLLGLPPTPEEVNVFIEDRRADAYERLVERLLDSPHYGERWARHWLDVVHFGESQGFERDKIRPNAWRYRDWVVDALNRDLPYDEFARLQIAGDVLRPGDAEGTIAAGFLVAGPYDEVGQTQQSAAMRAVVRQDELEDVVSMVGQTFLGLTVHCARCHDHKFDPIKQEEYYRLTAALAGVRHGERDVSGLRDKAIQGAAAMQRRIDELARQVAAIERPAVEQIRRERKERQKQEKVQPPKPIARWEFDKDLNDSIGKLHGTAKGGAKIEKGRLVLDGQTGLVATPPLDRDLKEKTLEAWVTLSNLTQGGGAAISVQTTDGNVFDAVVYGELVPRRWISGSDGFRRSMSLGNSDETQADREVVHMAVVYDADGLISIYRNGQPYGKPHKKSGLQTFKARTAQVLFGLRHGATSGNDFKGRLLAGAIERAALYDRALSADEVAASAGVASDAVSEEQIVVRLDAAQRKRREPLIVELDHLRELKERAAALRVYTVAPTTPEIVHVLVRGNPADPGPVVNPGGVAALRGVSAAFGLSQENADADRRKRLAAWITDAKNPLFARVMVNRLWLYHFGTGIVDTPSDFGFNGGRPSHPELLDWLASELVRQKWSLKQLHRAMVLSATYRQSSRSQTAGVKRDAGNRLLWRKSPLRLEAEVLRDAMLSAAGELNPELGGPGYQDFTTFTSNSQFYVMRDAIGRSFNRRSLYRTWLRSGRSQFLDVFDCPDPSTKTPKRAVTTTPLQALSLLNNSFVLRMSDQFAQRLRREAGEDPAKQIERAYQLAFGRLPSGDELSLTRAFVAEHGLPALCRVLFNSNEFLYVD